MSISKKSLKRIIQSDEDIGRMSQDIPIILDKVIDLYIKDILIKMVDHAKKETNDELNNTQQTQLSIKDLKYIIENNDEYDFLRELIPTFQDDTTSKTRTAGLKKPALRKEKASTPSTLTANLKSLASDIDIPLSTHDLNELNSVSKDLELDLDENYDD